MASVSEDYIAFDAGAFGMFPTKTGIASEMTPAPWTISKDYSIFGSGFEKYLDFFSLESYRLHEEILDFCAYISPKENEDSIRKNLVEKIRNIVLSVFPNTRVMFFGSMMTGLYLPTSDIDIVLPDVSALHSNYIKLSNAFQISNQFSYLEFIGRAKIPVIKMTDRESGIAVDLSLGIEDGIETSNYFCKKLNQYPCFKPLILVLKYFLHVRSLNITFSGGVGSFLACSMMLGFLQHEEKISRLSKRNLGDLLTNFFRYDSFCFFCSVKIFCQF